MQRKTLLSACIALALSGQGWAADITEVETTTGEKKNTNVTCPADPGKLSPEELKRLPSECTPLVEQNLMPWLATGAAALITTLAVVELGFAPIFPDICYHLTHYKPAAADIPVASDNPAHYADAIRYNARTPLQGSLLPLTRLVWA